MFGDDEWTGFSWYRHESNDCIELIVYPTFNMNQLDFTEKKKNQEWLSIYVSTKKKVFVSPIYSTNELE